MHILDKTIFEILDLYELPRPSSVFQAGASSGQEIDVFFTQGIEVGVFIEPLDLPFLALCKKCIGKNYIPLKAVALSSDNKEVNFYIASNSGQSSSIYKPDRHVVTYPTVSFDGPIKVKGHSVDSLAALARSQHNFLPAYHDLLFMDVQGAEMEVLKGASLQLQYGKYVFCEIGKGDGYEGEVAFESILTFLLAFGYRILALEWDPNTGYGNAFFIACRDNV